MRRTCRALAWVLALACGFTLVPWAAQVAGAAPAGGTGSPAGTGEPLGAIPAGPAQVTSDVNGTGRVGVEAWIYPGTPGQATCDVNSELSALLPQSLAAVKPQYLRVTPHGKVSVITAQKMPCNGFRPSSVGKLEVTARHVIVTVAAGPPGVGALLATSASRAAAQRAIVNFVVSNGFDGAELNFEPAGWSGQTWSSYMTFVAGLAQTLHRTGKELEVDMAGWTSTPPDAERYVDPVLAGARLVVMAFDHQYVQPCSPIAPYSWMRRVVAYVRSQVPLSDVTVGIPSYGYRAKSCTSASAVRDNIPYVTMRQEPGFPTTAAEVASHRDPSSGEIRWKSGQTQYDFVDATDLRSKLRLLQNLGVGEVAVWSLGGNPWFTGNP